MDPVVFFFNTRLMQEYWAVNAPSSSVSVLDVESVPIAVRPDASLLV